MTSRASISLLACLGLTLVSAGARGGTFDVSPLRVHLSPSAKSAIITVHNTSDTALRFEVSAYRWEQGADGRMELRPTKDVLFFPSLIAVEPGRTRNLRVGAVTPFGEAEKTYRVFVAEMPALERKGEAPGTVAVLTRLGIPIFLEPDKPAPGSKLDGAAVRRRHLTMQLRNTGNVHFFVTQVRVIGRGEGGAVRFERKAQGWYVLGGGERDYDVELPPECAQASEVEARIETEPPSLGAEARVAVTADDCAP